MKSVFRPWLLAACVTLGIGCTGETKNQVITGRITKTGALAVRAVSNGNVITAGRVHSDGTFTIALPKGTNYRLEVLTTAGVKPIVGGSNAPSTVTFKVCEPQNPWDLGGVEDGMGGGTPGCTDPMDPNCTDPDPCDPMDPNCLPPCDLNDPNCWPPECTDPMDPNCKPPGCTDPMDPHCWCTDPNDPNCMPPVCTDPMDPN